MDKLTTCCWKDDVDDVIVLELARLLLLVCDDECLDGDGCDDVRAGDDGGVRSDAMGCCCCGWCWC